MTPKNGAYFLKDLTSSTGTWLKHGNNDPIPIEDSLIMNIGSDEFEFSFGEEIDNLMEEWLRKYNLLEFYPKIKNLGYNNIIDFQEFKIGDVAQLTNDFEISKAISSAISDSKLDLTEDLTKRYLIVKNLATEDQHKISFDGARLSNTPSPDSIYVGSSKGPSTKNISVEECLIKYQYGKYWIINARGSPFREFFVKLKDQEQRLNPSDVIKVGTTSILVNRFNYGSYETLGTRGHVMEDRISIVQDLNVSFALDVSFFAVFDGHGGTHCVKEICDSVPSFLHENMLKGGYSNKENESIDNQDKFYAYMKSVIETSCKEADAEVAEKVFDYC